MQQTKPKVELFKATPDMLATVYRAARRCYSADIDTPKEADPSAMVKLVKNVIASGHTSILEHVSFTFHISGISRACSHQLVRHRMASYSQQSQRYADAQPQYSVPPCIGKNDALLAAYNDVMQKAYDGYEALVALGIPKEDARYVLPAAVTTSIVMTMNARELYETFFPLRLCTRAQWEIRDVAWQMLSACRCVFSAVFDGAGARCDLLGYCPEKNSCGRKPTLAKLIGGSNATDS